MVLLGPVCRIDNLWGASAVLPPKLAPDPVAYLPQLGPNLFASRRRCPDVGPSLLSDMDPAANLASYD